MLDLEAYKKEKNLCSQEVVNVIGTVYKKFDTPLELAVCDPDTGVVLEEQEATALTMKYGSIPKKQEKRIKESRFSLRMTMGQAKLFRKTLKQNGDSIQKLLFHAIDRYMRVNAPEEWKKENARTAATVPSVGE